VSTLRPFIETLCGQVLRLQHLMRSGAKTVSATRHAGPPSSPRRTSGKLRRPSGALASSGETPEGPRTVRDIGRQSRAEERADVSRIEDATPSPTTLEATVCSVAEFGPAEPVDWIITDPPYPREFLPVYADLAATAARILRPGGSLLCMVGQSYLPQIVERLTEHLPRSAARAASATRRSVPPSSVR